MAIDDNADYTLTGTQVKDLASKVKASDPLIIYTSAAIGNAFQTYSDDNLTVVITGAQISAAFKAGRQIILTTDTILEPTATIIAFTDGPEDMFTCVVDNTTYRYGYKSAQSRWVAVSRTVNDGTLTIQHNGTDVQTFTANQSTNATANIETIWADPIQATSAIEPLVQTDMIADGAVTADKTNFSTYGLNATVQIGTDIDDNTPVYRTTLGSNSLAIATSTWVLLGNLFGSGTGTVKTIYSLNFVLRDSGGTNFCAYGYDGGTAGSTLGTSRPLLAKVLSNGDVLIACANDNFAAAKVRVTVEYTKN